MSFLLFSCSLQNKGLVLKELKTLILLLGTTYFVCARSRLRSIPDDRSECVVIS